MPYCAVVVDSDPAVDDVVSVATRMDGVVAVAVGGSRAAGTADEHSDWDPGVYYRGVLDLAPLSAFDEVHPPGAWGGIMNGGAWLPHRGVRVDVVLCDSMPSSIGRRRHSAACSTLTGFPATSLASLRARWPRSWW
jgi:hypothetical protein